ncbi:MAG: transporter, partial [Hyphomicrobiaceae bacterium]|nr:transporter [Hyphomicrobiaceae bacterium]
MQIRWKNIGVAASLGLMVGIVGDGVLAAPITSNTALAISEEEWLVRQQVIVLRATDDPAGLGREFTATTSVSVAGYGLSSKLALFGVLPVAHKRLKTPAGTRESTGLGDVRLFARYTLFQKDGVGQTFRIAPFAGVELPTGRNEDRDVLGLLPTPVQLGSGSWDPFAGFVMTYATTGWQVDTSASYQDNRKADGVERGNVFKADASLQVRLWPDELTADTDSFLFGVLEANLIHEAKTELNGL